MADRKLTHIWDFFKEKLFPVPSQNNCRYPQFNPYKDVVAGIDRMDGAQIRSQNLHNYLSSFSEKPSTLMLGEAPGWRGCRFTGVPFTSENILIQKTLPFEGCPTSQGEQPYAEASATIFWRVMRKYHPSFFIWNCLPLHPHQPGNPLSNRRPVTTELRCHFALLEELIGILSPVRVISIGRCPQKALKELEIPCLYVRHPSHGGAREFQDGIERLMSVDQEDPCADRSSS